MWSGPFFSIFLNYADDIRRIDMGTHTLIVLFWIGISLSPQT